MTIAEDIARQETLSKMAESRAEIRRHLEAPPRERQPLGLAEDTEARVAGEFPRSRTMRTLLSGRGLGTAGAVVGGLLLARPALAFKLLRLLPTGAVARMLMLKAVTSWRSRP